VVEAADRANAGYVGGALLVGTGVALLAGAGAVFLLVPNE
jgi:hypothetical protein